MAAPPEKVPPEVAGHWEAVESQWGGGASQAVATAGDSDLQTLFRSAVALVHRLKIVAEELHQQGDLSASRRGVLLGLHRNGPQTVPQMARARPVSRQHIQALINPLVAEGYVELVDNPAHKRSRLVRLTARGVAFVTEMQAREARALEQLAIGCSSDDLRAAAAVLTTVKTAFEGNQWRRALQEEGDLP